MPARIASPSVQRSLYICPRCLLQQSLSLHSRRAFSQTRRTAKPHGDVLRLLETRGLVNQIAGDRNVLAKLLQTKRLGIYAGIDPTAPSLHLGHLLPLMVLFWLYLHGHDVFSLIGGATARVGDPSGRLTSRAATAEEVQRTNFERMWTQMEQVWVNAIAYGKRHGYTRFGNRELLNNADWLDRLNVLDFLKMLGSGMRVGTMLGRDTVRNKMERGDGMSFSEFAYPLLQGWDWWHMYKTRGVQIQVGGSDQYGNIVAGIDAVRSIAQSELGEQVTQPSRETFGGRAQESAPMGLTVPLLTTSGGEKFGKSAGNALWLDQNLTSSFDLYGFLLRSADADVERYLKLFTFVSEAEIASTMREHHADPGKRKSQHLLASEVLELVHGREEASKARAEHEAMRRPKLDSLARTSAVTSNSGMSSRGDTPESGFTPLLPNLQPGESVSLAQILHLAQLVSSRSAGSRLLAGGGVYIASSDDGEAQGDLKFTQILDSKAVITREELCNGCLVIRIGKWKVRTIRLVETATDA